MKDDGKLRAEIVGLLAIREVGLKTQEGNDAWMVMALEALLKAELERQSS